MTAQHLSSPAPSAEVVRQAGTDDGVEWFSFRAMATDVGFFVLGVGSGTAQSIDDAAAVFARVEAACTRFDPGSPLMRANDAGVAWFPVPPECFDAISTALAAHRLTDGVFDPRVLDSLVALGYDRSLPFTTEPIQLPDAPDNLPCLPFHTDAATPRWAPGLNPVTREVRIGPRPIDLGGIGKGLAVRWARAALTAAGVPFLIDAGGDLYMSGSGPLGTGWRVGVEDPYGGEGADPIAVLQLSDAACATSSVRARSWRRGSARVHHLIDPRTGRSCSSGLQAVTVAGPDTADAEVWSKTLLIHGAARIADVAARHHLAALWVDDAGALHVNDAMRQHVIWPARP